MAEEPRNPFENSAHDRYKDSGLEPVPYTEPPIHYAEDPIVYQVHPVSSDGEDAVKAKKHRRWCGMRLVTILLLVIIAILVALVVVLAALFANSKATQNTTQNVVTTATANPVTQVPISSATSPTSTPSLSSSTSPTSTSPTSTSPTPSSSSSTATTGPGGVKIECPSANGTTYTSQGQTFLRLCSSENTPQLGSLDISNITAVTMSDCIDACTKHNADSNANDKCVGVNWITRKPQGEANSYCWLKSKINDAEDWDGCEAGILIE